MPEPRADLVRSLLQSCYVIERARAGVQAAWGGDFSRDADRTTQRADRLGRLLDEMGHDRKEDVVARHTDWFTSLVGSRPDEVPLGAAVLHQFGKWSDVFAGPYLGGDADDFRMLGAEHARVDLEFSAGDDADWLLPELPLPSGRRFVILTDVHIGSRGRDVLARRAVEDINALSPEFVVIPGDFTEDGEPEQFRQAKEIFDGLACPYHIVPGNHDAVQRSTREPFGGKFFAETFGREVEDVVVGCGDLQVALVDSTDPTPSPFPDWDIGTGRVGGVAAGVDSGALAPGQPEELARKIDPSRPVLLVQHHELHPFPGFPPVKFALREEDAAAELDALSSYRLMGVVAGHTHRSAVLPVGDGSVTQLEVPALKDWPFAYSVVGVTDDAVEVVVRQVSDHDTVLKIARVLPPLMRRFAIGPLSDLAYRFTF